MISSRENPNPNQIRTSALCARKFEVYFCIARSAIRARPRSPGAAFIIVMDVNRSLPRCDDAACALLARIGDGWIIGDCELQFAAMHYLNVRHERSE